MTQQEYLSMIKDVEINTKSATAKNVVTTADKVYICDSNDLSKMKKYIIGYSSDFCAAHGCEIGRIPKQQPGILHSCNYLLRDTNKHSKPFYAVDDRGKLTTFSVSNHLGIRPCITLDSQTFKTLQAKYPSELNIQNNGKYNQYYTIKFGRFPQKFVSFRECENLTNLLKNHRLNPTGKSWTAYYNTSTSNFDEYPEYEYNGEFYVKVVNSGCNENSMDSNNHMIYNGHVSWCKVEPLTWVVTNYSDYSAKSNEDLCLMTEECVLSDIPMVPSSNGENWSNSVLRNGLNNRFIKEMTSPQTVNATMQRMSEEKEKIIKEETKKKSTTLSRLNMINPDKSQLKRQITDTEIIKDWIDAGQSVLLRGPSGIGKTERLKKLYPNLIYIKLTNNMFPEKVVGSMNLQTGEAVPPDFAKQAILSCATEKEKKLVEEDMQNLYKIADDVYNRSKNSKEKVVILLDELLNVKQSVQSLVYTLVLNKLVETGSGLKLPANTVVVATGNQKKYSAVAEDLAEPLEKRFDHILDMKPKVSEWLYEYAIPNKLHPSIISYILSKYNENRKSEDIKDIGYFYEEPEIGDMHIDQFGCRGKTNDPRGWTSISDMLYNFEKQLKNGKYIGYNVEDLLVKSLNSKLRKEWAFEFFDFYNNPTLTVQEIVDNSFSQEALPQNISDKFACMAGLLSANEKDVKVCRDFIRKYCSPEYLSVFDIYWVGNDKERMQLIYEYSQLDILGRQDSYNQTSSTSNLNKDDSKYY